MSINFSKLSSISVGSPLQLPAQTPKNGPAPTINQLLWPFYGQGQNSHQATQGVNTVNSTQAHQATQYVQPGAKLPTNGIVKIK